MISFLYLIFAFVNLPLIFCFQNHKVVVLAIGAIATALLLVIVIVSCYFEKKYKKDMYETSHLMECLNEFSNDTFVCSCIVTSMGLLLTMIEKWAFWAIYVLMLILFIVPLTYDVIIPMKKYKKNKGLKS